MMPADIQVVGRVVIPQERVAVSVHVLEAVLQPLGKSSLTGTCHATIS